jgi:hypothetical protein
VEALLALMVMMMMMMMIEKSEKSDHKIIFFQKEKPIEQYFPLFHLFKIKRDANCKRFIF